MVCIICIQRYSVLYTHFRYFIEIQITVQFPGDSVFCIQVLTQNEYILNHPCNGTSEFGSSHWFYLEAKLFCYLREYT